MLEIVLTSSESDQYSGAPKEISKFPLMYMTGYFCRSVYFVRLIMLFYCNCFKSVYVTFFMSVPRAKVQTNLGFNIIIIPPHKTEF